MGLRLVAVSLIGGFFFAALPNTTNYKLQSFGFGSGGGSTSTSNYSLQGISGETSGNTPFTANYAVKPGFIQTEQANVPVVTLSNPSSYYDKLKFLIDNQNNPADATFELQVCVGADFTPTSCAANGGTLRYLKNDDTLGTSLSLADYQTYTAWGGASGQNIIGLSPGTTYYIHALATQGKYTESGYGPSSSAATSSQSISFCVYSGGSCGTSNSVTFAGGLTAGTVATSGNIGVNFATNADSGGSVYVYSSGNLSSVIAPGSPIPSATADLSSATQGYGAQVQSVAQTSGGPLAKISPYDLSANNVGVLSTVANIIFNSNAPIVGGTGTVQLQAKASNTTPSAPDYTDTLTVIAAASF